MTIVATTPTTVEDGGSSGLFTVSRMGLTTAALTVNFTLGGSATAGSDFTDPGGSVTIAAGQSTATITIAPLDDGDGDDALGSQNVVATLSGSSSYNVGAANHATVTIDEESPPTVTIAATTPTTLETGASPGVFTVSRTGPTDDPLTVSYSTSGSASAGSDYTALSGSVTIPIGQSSATIDVSPIDDGDGDDTTASATVTATLASSAGYTIGSANSATVTIDEDLLPTVTISATTPSVAEVGGGSGTFTVSLSAAASNNITVSYATTGTAVAGSDYQALSGSVLVPAGQTSATISDFPRLLAARCWRAARVSVPLVSAASVLRDALVHATGDRL